MSAAAWQDLPRREFGPPGDLRDRLCARILAGEKTATTSVARPGNPTPHAHVRVWSDAGVETDDDTLIHCIRFWLGERA